MRPAARYSRKLLAKLQQPLASTCCLALLVSVWLTATAQSQVQPGQLPERQLTQRQLSQNPSIPAPRGTVAQAETNQQIGLPNASWQGHSGPSQASQSGIEPQTAQPTQHSDLASDRRAQPLLTQPPSGTLRDSQFHRSAQPSHQQQSVTPASGGPVSRPGSPMSVSSAASQETNGPAVVTASASQPIGSQPAFTAAASANPTLTPLQPPTPGNQQTKQRTGSTSQMLVSVGSSLIIVMGLFFGFIWFYRKSMGARGNGGLPKNVVQVLGRTPVAPRQNLVLLRFGSKLVLVSMVQGEARTISEITDPLEVDQLSGLCESQQSSSMTHSFREILAQGVKA